MERVPSTPAGREALIVELKRLKEVERPQLVQDIAEARAHGDLRENSEYHDAKHRQGLLEGRIQELESVMARIQVIEPTSQAGTTIRFGATVTIERDGKEQTYQIVGEHEANIDEGRIAIAAPLARNLIGKEAGDFIEMGEHEIEILRVEYV